TRSPSPQSPHLRWCPKGRLAAAGGPVAVRRPDAARGRFRGAAGRQRGCSFLSGNRATSPRGRLFGNHPCLVEQLVESGRDLRIVTMIALDASERFLRFLDVIARDVQF